MKSEISINKLKRKDKQTQEKLFKILWPNVFHQCLRTLKNRQDAEDCASLAIAKAMLKINTFKGNSALTSWVYSIARNECLMLIRQRKPSRSLEPKEFSYEMLDDLFLKEWTALTFSNLPEKYKQPIKLVSLGLKPEEAASILNLTTAAYKTRLGRARVVFKQAFKE